jgi:transposase
VIGFQDETWWSRFTQPHVHAWSPDGEPLHLVEQTPKAQDADGKALACYGVLLRSCPQVAEQWEETIWLRFVDGRPVSAITTQFLAGCCAKLQAQGKRVWILVWDNALWHTSHAVKAWVRTHNQQVKQTDQGVRIFVCPLPIKSPWLNPIEPKWVHGKRRIVEPNRTLPPLELEERVCAALGCSREAHLSFSENVT